MIRFGTSGWRGLIAEEVTLERVRRVAAAVAGYLHATGQARKGALVGYDVRFLSDRFALEAARELAARGVPATLARGPAPVPAVAHAVLAGRRAIGLTITAGHDAFDRSGLKLAIASGAPAPSAVTQAIERLAAAASGSQPAASTGRRRPGKAASFRHAEIRQAYLRRLGRSVRLPAIKRARLRIAVDPRHGASIGFLDAALKPVTRQLEVLNGTPHPEFGELGPDCGETQLRPLCRAVRRGGLHLGLATDGDGDRFGIVDAGGSYIPPSLFLAALAEYLIVERGMSGGVCRTVATTHLLDAVCAENGREILETPVGFKHLAVHLEARRAFLACEEGGGLGLAAHLPEKDGILAGLLAAEMVAVRRRPLREQIRDLLARIGALHGRRIDYHADPASRDRLIARLQSPPQSFAGRRVERVDDRDGLKMIFHDGSWILVRSSDSEPLIRCHIESRTQKDLEVLTAAARDLIARGSTPW